MIWFLFLISSLLTAGLMTLFSWIAQGRSLLRENYKGEMIPFPGGIVLALVIIIGVAPGLALNAFSLAQGSIFLFIVLVSSLVGLVDDFMGDSVSKGFKGHFIKLLEDGELTTGAVKAIFGGLGALAAGFALVEGNPLWGIVNGVLIALTMNTINLLDLRPGRACKGFLFGFGLLILLIPDRSSLPLFMSILGALFIYMPWDLKARVMMGDTGSNLLGGLLGFYLAQGATRGLKVLAILVLTGLMIFTENRSLTHVIEGNRLLNLIDRAGRDE